MGLLAELLFDQRVRRGGRVSFADMGGRVVQMEKQLEQYPQTEQPAHSKAQQGGHVAGMEGERGEQ